jgi:hypothetical protein
MIAHWAATPDVPFAFSFCAGCPGPENPTFLLKQQPCPHCERIGALNRHSLLRGNDPTAAAGQWLRGQRVFCSNRGRRGGCGRTFSLCLAEVLPRHTITAPMVWRWLLKLLAGLSLKSAAESLQLPFALETFYRLRRSLRRKLDLIRARLCRRQAPPSSLQSDPLLQTVEHLQAVFPGAECAPPAFQLHSQRPFLG